ncbi:MAG: ABC transporter ATP-binding protein [Myxococcota bacterium]
MSAAASPLQGESTVLDTGQTLGLLRRALRYAGPFRSRFAVKLGLGFVSLVPLVLLPWPVKILVDQVIEGIPVGETLLPYPFFIEPLARVLEGSSSGEIVAWCIGIQALLLLAVGAIGTSSRERDATQGYLASGEDTATRTENEANAGFSLAGGLLGYLDFRYTLRLTQALNHHYRSELFERIQSLPMSAFDDERIGDAIYRVMYDTPSITSGVYRILLTPILSVFTIGMTVWVLWLAFGGHPTIWLATFAFGPLVLLATLPFSAALRRRASSSRFTGSNTTTTVEEGMANVLAVQSLGGEGREQERFHRDSWDSFSEYRGVVRIAFLAALFAILPGLLLYGYVFLYAVDLVIDGLMTRGDFVLFLTYSGIVIAACIELGTLWINVQGSAAGLARVFFLMDMPREVDAPDAGALPPVRRSLALDGVSFRFPDGTEAVRDVSLTAKVGEVCAFVGPAGAGKTTLASLLCGYLAPTGGRVLADGRDLAGYTRESVRDRIAFVFQETQLFDDTVAANLRLGRPDASDADLRRAAERAGADAFIRELPDGYQTRLGRAGGKLSVGQKQRLSIARALVRDADVLVLDEPTSALDPQTERDLVAALREASRDRLVVVIAHRLSTIRAADRIHFVEAGRIRESGSHEALMQRPEGAYRRFVDLQTGSAQPA